MFKKKDFCTNCRTEEEYVLQKKQIKNMINNTEYTFSITSAVCQNCGEEMNLPGMIDQNIREVDEQYRKIAGIVTVSDIENLMELYNIGKAPLSLVLGFGEVTITRYLSGQIPSKKYSDIIRKALISPNFMHEKLAENKQKITDVAYAKAEEAVKSLQAISSISEEMRRSIAYLFVRLEEITPLALQKLLYFCQGISCVLNEKPLFSEQCQAWVHGPVFPEVYELFRNFKYNPIEDKRFIAFAAVESELTEDERKIIDLVVATFGKYGGKMLEKITHAEKPWQIAREGCAVDTPSQNQITLSSIREYYKDKNAQYNFARPEGIKKYIADTIGVVA